MMSSTYDNYLQITNVTNCITTVSIIEKLIGMRDIVCIDDSIVTFKSDDTPPIDVYEKIIMEFPEVGLYYEYHRSGVGSEADPGQVGNGWYSEGMSNLTMVSYIYKSPEEYQQIREESAMRM